VKRAVELEHVEVAVGRDRGGDRLVPRHREHPADPAVAITRAQDTVLGRVHRSVLVEQGRGGEAGPAIGLDRTLDVALAIELHDLAAAPAARQEPPRRVTDDLALGVAEVPRPQR